MVTEINICCYWNIILFFGSRTPNSVANCGSMTENWKALWRWISKHKQVLNCKTELNFLNFILKIMTLFSSSLTLTLASSEVGTFKVNVPKIKWTSKNSRFSVGHRSTACFSLCRLTLLNSWRGRGGKLYWLEWTVSLRYFIFATLCYFHFFMTFI